MAPRVSVLLASDRVETGLEEALGSLENQRGAPSFEAIVASSAPPGSRERGFPVRWIEAADRNPAGRRNRAAAAAAGPILAFLDDDAAAEPGWLAAGVAALSRCEIAGGPDRGPSDAPYGERLADLLLATPWIGSGVPAHELSPRPGPVRSPHDVALCNLFVRRDVFETLGGLDESIGYVGEDTDFIRRALSAGLRVELEPEARVRHRRRGFPAAYLAQRWRYRVKTGRLLVERPGLHARGRVAAFLSAAFGVSAALALLGPVALAPAAALYATLCWALSFPIWRGDPALFPAVPFAFALHHATYLAGLLVGMARGAAAPSPR